VKGEVVKMVARRIAMFMALVATAGVLSACQPETEGTAAGSAPDCPGGQVVRGFAGPVCVKPTPDAGMSCSKATDCSGVCLADSRTCSAQTPMLGCFDFLDEAGQKLGLCVD
jgi:hypothetical protein